MKAGDTFIIEQPGTSLDSHLWMVISDPNVDPHEVVLLNFTTWRADKDQACIVEVGDHAFIRHRTCVNYGGAKVVSAAAIQSLVTNGRIAPRQPLSTDLLERIRNGAAESRSMPMGVAAILARQGLIDI